MIYDYECPKCNTVNEVIHSMRENPVVECEKCNVECKKVFLQAPTTVIAPEHQAVPNKLKYYGIKNPVTGEGITEHTDVRDKPGVRVKSIK